MIWIFYFSTLIYFIAVVPLLVQLFVCVLLLWVATHIVSFLCLLIVNISLHVWKPGHCLVLFFSSPVVLCSKSACIKNPIIQCNNFYFWQSEIPERTYEVKSALLLSCLFCFWFSTFCLVSLLSRCEKFFQDFYQSWFADDKFSWFFFIWDCLDLSLVLEEFIYWI